ncbi:Uncharacterised protein [Bordetella pertussis]|nr:Uncharacterised protein [Bordetella pertussis]CPM23603.1 Uncharacterised protein [Bordetella pertussis]CPO00482.1 Uncharacterised protein [Bordetella pertussis]
MTWVLVCLAAAISSPSVLYLEPAGTTNTDGT